MQPAHARPQFCTSADSKQTPRGRITGFKSSVHNLCTYIPSEAHPDALLVKGVIAAEVGDDVRISKLVQANVALFLLLLLLLLRLRSKGRLNSPFEFVADYPIVALVLFS